MSQTSEYLQEAHNLHEAGRLADAAEYYLRHLDGEPEHVDALAHLAALYSLQGQGDAAADCYRRIIALRPDEPAAFFNLGNTLQSQGNAEEAERCYRQALDVDPNHGSAMVNLGSLLMQAGKLREAQELLTNAVTVAPDLVEAHSNLGATLLGLGDAENAIGHLERARALKPDDAAAQANLAMALQETGHPDAAVHLYDEALKAIPNSAVIRSARATALRDLDQLDDSLEAFDQLIAIAPHYAQGHSNRAVILQNLGRLKEALAAHEIAVTLAPEIPEIRWNYAQTLLLSGDYERGWPEFEWRLECRKAYLSRHAAPRWDGSSLRGKTILLTLERGLGDTIQYCRLARVLKDRGARTALECQSSLVRLLHSCEGIDTFVTPGDTGFGCDVQAPLVSLPGLLSLDRETIPGDTPYLNPPVTPKKAILNAIRERKGLRIGVCWAGSRDHTNDRRRSCPRELMAHLSEIPGVAVFSLQKEKGPDDVAYIVENQQIADLSPLCDDFADTAAAIAELDLVISVDTAVAHLAGAIGQQVWNLLPYSPDWRWGHDASTTPWYSTMRLIRQPFPGDWEGVFRIIQAEAQKITAGN